MTLVSDRERLPPIVLVVDGDADTREMYKAAFGLAGLWMGHAEETDDALNYALELRPDAVVIDLSVAAADERLSLARDLRENPRTAETPLVAVSSLLRSEGEPGAGVFNEVFWKPVPLPIFARHVRWLAAQASVLRERSRRARARLPDLLARSQELLSRSANLKEKLSAMPLGLRVCPECGKPLRFLERQQLDGVLFDYYTPCPSGCGLFCYDHSRGQFVRFLQ